VSESSPVQKRWFELLDGALDVFQRSIATLQYVIEDSLQQVWICCSLICRVGTTR
jgi:hypothetical protein